MSNEPEPSSLRLIIGSFLLSVAFMILTTQFISKRVELRSIPKLGLKDISQQVYAESLPEVLAPQTTPEPAEAPKPAEPVQIPPTAPVSQPEPVKPKPAPRVVDQVGAKAFIYQKESGNNPRAINKGSGACGIGQALPCSKMPCTLDDYACQDAFFTKYMEDRYGTWENAKAFWQCKGKCYNRYGSTIKTATWW